MKKSLLLALVLALPLSQAAQADDHDNNHPSQRRSAPAARTTQQRVQAAQQQGIRNSQNRPALRVNPAYPLHRTPTATRSNYSAPQTRTYPDYNAASRRAITTRPVVDSGRFRDRSRENNAHIPNNAAAQNRQPTTGNHAHRNYDRNSYFTARHREVHGYHDRGWWRSRYNTNFVLFGGGYYYFNDGYWFPAYGYDPAYNNYAYNEPIYGYNDLPPGQVLENVQLALRDQGYYRGAIDGLIGPETRAALAAFQRDHGLLITEAVDEPTLVQLGLA